MPHWAPFKLLHCFRGQVWLCESRQFLSADGKYCHIRGVPSLWAGGEVCCEETTPGLRAASQEHSVNDCHSENGFSHFLQPWPHEPRQVWVWTKLWWLPICLPRLFTGQRNSWMGGCNWGRPWVYCFGSYIQRPSLIPLAHGTIPCSEPPACRKKSFQESEKNCLRVQASWTLLIPRTWL